MHFGGYTSSSLRIQFLHAATTENDDDDAHAEATATYYYYLLLHIALFTLISQCVYFLQKQQKATQDFYTTFTHKH